MNTRPVHVRFEQAVYGSFPFWDRGYGVLAHSAGCRIAWLSELRTICQHYGEPPAAAPEADGLFALPLKSGPWTIVGVHHLGNDDHDRPGALAFHALFVTRWAYRWAGADPFTFAEAIRRQWSAADQDRILPAGCLTARRRFPANASATAGDQRPAAIVTALTQGRRVVVRSIEPIDTLARNVWNALPYHVRRRTSLATWAFDNANGFDLVALPKLARGPLDSSDLVLGVESAGH
jgi:hypothetical protein